MSTEKVTTTSKKVVYLEREDVLVLGLYNDSGAELFQGQEVILKTDGTVDERNAGTEFPFGVITIGGLDGGRVAVRTFFQEAIKGIASGAINAGVGVKPTGVVDANGQPQYAAAAVSEWIVGYVIEGGADTEEISIGLFNSPVLNVPA